MRHPAQPIYYTMRVDTVTILTGNGEVVINATDYDPEKHKLSGEKKPVKRRKATKQMSKQA